METVEKLNFIYSELDKLDPKDIQKVIDYLENKKNKKLDKKNDILLIINESIDKIKLEDIEFYVHSNCFIYKYKDISYTDNSQRSINNKYFNSYDRSWIDMNSLIIKKHQLWIEYTMFKPVIYDKRAWSYIWLTLLIKNWFEVQDEDDIRSYLNVLFNNLNTYWFWSLTNWNFILSDNSKLSDEDNKNLVKNAKISLVKFLNKHPDKIKKT